MKQFGPQATHQRTTRSWAFGYGGPGFEVRQLVDRCERVGDGQGVGAAGARAMAGDRSAPDGNHGDNLGEVQR